MPEFRLRLQVKAGLTGYAQVYGKYNTNPYDKLEMDLMYIANQSILQDLKLMFATVKILFQAESTQGVADGKTTAGKENPEHISVYSLIIEEGTPFYERYREDEKLRDAGKEPQLLPSEESERAMYELTGALLADYGYERYEISNYAKAGRLRMPA